MPVDFEVEHFDDELLVAGFDPTRPSVVAWLGVTYYLTPEAINDTLARVARLAPETSIIFDYHLPERLFDSFGAAFDGNAPRGLLRMLAATGEPMISFFTPDEVEALLRSHGYHNIEHLDHVGIRERFMQGQTATTPGPVPFFPMVKAEV